MEKDLQGKTVIITGASRGIGAATVDVFAAAGANVVLLARSEVEIAEKASAIGAKALALPCDVADYSQVESAVQSTVKHFGGVDVLIGNAGMIEPISLMAEADPTEWARAISVNLTGVFNGMRAAVPHMRKAGAGTIITVSSGAAHNAIEGWSSYCASKAGAAMLTRSAHLENADAGLRIMGMSPGTVATQMQREIKASGVNPVSELAWEDHIPAEWPARALLWMCGRAADAYCGEEVSLRDATIRTKVGLE